MRQTNAVWLIFFASIIVLKRFECLGIYNDKSFSFSKFFQLIIELFKNIPIIIMDTWSLLLPVILFISFVFYNGSVVVGKNMLFIFYNINYSFINIHIDFF
jgi:hypothetical protein